MKKTTRIVAIVLLIITIMLAASSCSFLSVKMSTVNPWVEDDSEIIKVEVINTYFGIEPNLEMKSYYTEDFEIIDKYMEWVGELSLVPSIFQSRVGGGGDTRMVFTLADGSIKEIYTKHGTYYSSLMSFVLYNELDYDYSSDMTVFYRFNVSDNNYSIYTYKENPTIVKESDSGAETLGFIPLQHYEDPETEPTHCLEASFGKVYFYSDTLCYIDTESEYFEYNNGYYMLYGTSLSELME